jgi:hypothetical protein
MVMVLTMTENNDCCQVIEIRASIVFSPARAKRSASWGCAQCFTSHRRERLISVEQFRLAPEQLFPVHERLRVIAQAQIQERHDRQRQQRDREAPVGQDRKHDGERRDRVREREDAAHHEVFDRIGVDVHAVDRVARARRDVVIQAERLEMVEELVAQVVDHPLAGVHLHLRAVRGHQLIHDLQHDAGDDDGNQQRRLAAVRHAGDERLDLRV